MRTFSYNLLKISSMYDIRFMTMTFPSIKFIYVVMYLF